MTQIKNGKPVFSDVSGRQETYQKYLENKQKQKDDAFVRRASIIMWIVLSLLILSTMGVYLYCTLKHPSAL